MARLHEIIAGAEVFRPAIVLGVLTLVLYLFDRHPQRRLRHLRHPILWLGLFFTAWAALGAPYAFDPDHATSFLVDDFTRVLILAALIALAVRDVSDVRKLMMALVLGGVLFSLVAALPADFRAVVAGAYDPNDSAMFIVLVLPLAVFLFIEEDRPAMKLVLAIAVMLAMIGLVRTGSRGGFVAFAAVFGYMVFLYRGLRLRYRVLTVVALLGTLAATASTEYWTQMRTIANETDYNRTDVAGRLAIWDRAQDYIAERPVFGVGVGNFTVAEERHPTLVARVAEGKYVKYSAPHSIWYQVGAEIGLPGLAAYVALFLTVLIQLRSLTTRVTATPESRTMARMAAALIGSLLAVMVAGTFLSNAYTSMVWGVFGLALGLLKLRTMEVAGRVAREAGPAVTSAPRWRNVAFATRKPRTAVAIRRTG